MKKKKVLQWAPCNYRKRENDGCADVWQYLLERTGGTYEGVNDYVSRTTTITLAEGSLVGNGAELERFALESLPLSTMDKMILISILNCPPIMWRRPSMNSQDVLFYGDNRKLREEAGWKEARCLDDITHHEGFVINWGKWIPESVRLYSYNTSTGHRINFYSSSNKEKELLILEAAGIRVPKVIDMVHIRTTNHHGGGDFDPNRSGVFVTEHIDTIMEYRLHVVGEWAILGGSKHPLVPNPHPFVRSYKKGWGIEYDQSSFVRDRCREIGVASIKALGLDFGAVDIGEKENGDLVVWEVNRKPGLFPLARTRYIKSLNRLIEERS